MAIYKGRSVQIISVTPVDEPSITISHKDGSTSLVKPSELMFTKFELDRIQKDIQMKFTPDPKTNPNPKAPIGPNYKLIEDKDHQELLDGQDPVKMELKLKNTPNVHEITVPAQSIAVTPLTGRNDVVNKPVVVPASTK